MTDPDDLEPLLAPRPAGRLRPGFDAELFARTERALARGRRLRRAGRTAVVAGVFAGGWFAGSGVRPEPPPALVPLAEVVAVPVVVPVPAAAESAPVLAPAEPATAAAAELLAEQADDPARAARLYRLAGDRFLLDAQDFRNARRCYRLSLARAGDTGLSPAADDTWLLADLKLTLAKERFDAPKNDG